ncbi:dienelactone hydrolase family protein [Streptomyces sp. NPDC051569]|uniref:dienelactone hydrolase family protein n=1 Tax=Streptomyces sp. NPDC051569 TaxID=3365661 RepID=UPI00378B468D
MHSADIEYAHEGVRLVGRLVVDDSRPGKRPAVLVSHDAGGLGEQAKDTARRLAELGYAAFALDYFGDGAPLPSEQVGPRLGQLSDNPLRTRGIAQAGLDALLASEYADATRVAAIGYCFGGTLSLELARGGADLKAVVGFHSGLKTGRPQDASQITGRVLVCIGADDPFIPADQRLAFEEEMRAGGVDWQTHLYGGAVHSFTSPTADGSGNPGVKYDRLADERSWRSMLDLFAEVF